MNNKYTKVTYQSEPIGKERIILYLTTFDLEAFEKNEKIEKIPTKIKSVVFEFEKADIFNNPNLALEMNNKFEKIFEDTYKKQLEEMKGYIEFLRKTKIVPMEYNTNVKSITNSDDVHCNIVYGNITNCDNIYCNEIKGNVVNCDKIIYKKEEIK